MSKKSKESDSSADNSRSLGDKVSTALEASRDKVGSATGAVKQRARELGERVPELSTGQKVAVAVGAAAVTAAIVAAIKKRRASGAVNVLHLEPVPQSDGWRLILEGEKEAEAVFDNKSDADSAARELAREWAPSELVVHRLDGSEQDRHSYS